MAIVSFQVISNLTNLVFHFVNDLHLIRYGNELTRLSTRPNGLDRCFRHVQRGASSSIAVAVCFVTWCPWDPVSKHLVGLVFSSDIRTAIPVVNTFGVLASHHPVIPKIARSYSDPIQILRSYSSWSCQT